MCGIAGTFAYRVGAVADRDAVAGMIAVVRHRGPDGAAVAARGPLALGHARLSIIDVAGGRQPIFSEDGRVAVVCNGEIYNHRALRAELEARGHVFATRSDAEVVVHLYEESGAGCCERLRGMFALAVADFGRRRLLLARDRLGKKPLYLADDGRRLAFASELKSLLAGGAIGGETDPEALDLYLAYGYVPAPWTIFRGARKLPAGHLAEIDEHGVRVRRWWDVESEPAAALSEDEAAERLEELLAEAVGLRLESEVPLGAFLSGGIDSGTVVSFMRGGPVETHTVGFADPALDERDDAARVAAALGTDHTVSVVEPDLAEVLPRIAWHLDEPFADPSAVPTWYLARETRRRVTVALSGDGGDELFAGYPGRYGMPLWEARARRLVPTALRRRGFPLLARHWPRSPRLPRALRLGGALANLATDADRAYYQDRCQIRPALAERLLLPGREGRLDPFVALEPHLDRAPRDPLARALYLDLKTWLADDILVKVDRMSMAHGLEVRCPLLDHRLVEFAARLPSRFKLARGRTKVLLRRVAARRLPREIVERPKRGFAPPVTAWLRRPPLSDYAHEILLAPGSLARGVCDATALRRLLRDHALGKVDAGRPLWTLLMLEAWSLAVEKPRAMSREALVAAGV